MAPDDTSSSEGRRIGDHSEEHLLNYAFELIEEKSQLTTIFDKHSEEKIPKFQRNELEVGRVLGRGGFCVVSEIPNITLHDDENDAEYSTNHDTDDHDGGIIQNREFMQQYCIRDGSHARYAIKQLSKETLNDSELFVKGMMDLVLEAKFLAVIRHPHIIKMRANAAQERSPQCFLVLDRLYETLPSKMTSWNQQAASGSCCCFGNNDKKNEIWVERLLVANDLASALKYLHGINIVYRDLKPDNIRFDVRGDVKLFDFGLARELNPKLLVDQDSKLYQMTGDTGSIAYMAPEVAKEKPYNETVDTYSFGILLWQLCKGAQQVYEGFTYNMILNSVVHGGARPPMDPTWSVEMQQLMNRCWSKDIARRPSMDQIMIDLRTEIRNLDNNSGGAGRTREEMMMDVSSRSIHSLHMKKQQEQQQQQQQQQS